MSRYSSEYSKQASPQYAQTRSQSGTMNTRIPTQSSPSPSRHSMTKTEAKMSHSSPGYKYRLDYSRSQHSNIRDGEVSHSLDAYPSSSQGQNEHRKLEVFMNRFTTPPTARLDSDANYSEPIPKTLDTFGKSSPPLSVSERISRFNNVGGTPPRSYTPNSIRATSFSSSQSAPSTSKGYLQRSASTSIHRKLDIDYYAESSFHSDEKHNESILHENPAKNNQSNKSLIQKKLNATTSSTTSTATMSTNTTHTEQQQASSERRQVLTSPRESNPLRLTNLKPNAKHITKDASQLTTSYNLPHNAEIEIQPTIPVSELRKKLWDNNETLQVAVPPSLHYPLGRSSGDAAKPSTTKAELPPGSNTSNVTSRFGQRARSHSPKRPQYNSSPFKSRFYQAALASRQRDSRSTSSPLAQRRNHPRDEKVSTERRTEVILPKLEESSPRYASEAMRDEAIPDSSSRNRGDSTKSQEQRLAEILLRPLAAYHNQDELDGDYGPRKKSSLLQQANDDSKRLQGQFLTNELRKDLSGAERRLGIIKNVNDSSSATVSTFANPISESSFTRKSNIMSSMVDEESYDTGEVSVAKLVAKLAAISRDNPKEALAQIDSILRAESKSSSIDKSQITITALNHLRNNEYHDLEDDDDSETSDDETSMSSITNPSFSIPSLGNSHLQNLMSSGSRQMRPNSLQQYQNHQRPGLGGDEAKGGKSNYKNKSRILPPATIQVKEPISSLSARSDLMAASSSYVDSKHAAAIAMRVQLWDELSHSKVDSKGDEAPSIVPSLQEEVISAATDELGSIITPSDPIGTESENSSQRESPLFMSNITTPQSSLLYPTLDMSPATSHDGSQENRPPHVDVENSGNFLKNENNFDRSSSNMHSSAQISKTAAMRRSHPWDQHYPRTCIDSSNSEVGALDGFKDFRETIPTDHAPVTSPRNAAKVRKNNASHLGSTTNDGDARVTTSIIESRDYEQYKSKTASADKMDAQGDMHSTDSITAELQRNADASLSEKGVLNNGVSNSSVSQKSSGKVQKSDINGVHKEKSLVPGAFKSSHSIDSHFEVDPKLLRSTDEFGFPIRVKVESRDSSIHTSDQDTAWEVDAVNTFFPSPKASYGSSSPNRVSNSAERDVSVIESPDLTQKSQVKRRQSKTAGGGLLRLMKLRKNPEMSSVESSVPSVNTSSKLGGEKDDDHAHSATAEKQRSPGGKIRKGFLKSRRSYETIGLELSTSSSLELHASPPVVRSISSSPSRRVLGPSKNGNRKILERLNRMMKERNEPE
jgi:hypothetical protein